jgi:hypothetical protein
MVRCRWLMFALRAILFAALGLNLCPKNLEECCETLPSDALMSHTDRLILKVAKWGFWPVVIDREATLVCGQFEFEFHVARDSALQSPAPKPLSVTPARAIHTPRPTPGMIQRIRTRMDHARGTNRTSYCIDENGRVIDVKTRQKFYAHRYDRSGWLIYDGRVRGDARIDRWLRELVATWRFEPLVIDGQPHKSCAVATFDLEFR